MAKTDNKKYIQRGVYLCLEYDSDWEEDAKRANKGKGGAPCQYAEASIMLLRSGWGWDFSSGSLKVLLVR